jgi:methylthioribose-1-phosphate isomerase
MPPTVDWQGSATDGELVLIDQTLLPLRLELMRLTTLPQVIDAIRRLCVRGAPAIGVAGAYGVVIALRQGLGDKGIAALADARPTAVNLRWAVERTAKAAGGSPEAALAEARRIHAEDQDSCRRIGQHGAALVKDGMGVLTHCNAGALATAGMGTALAPLYVAHEQGRRFKLYADETRPLLQGARLTAFEAAGNGLDVTVITDNMAAWVMKLGKVQLVITGADRVAANGDSANKIGTYGVALAAKAHGIPFYIAAPRSTFDAALADGSAIPIEERDGAEVRRPGGTQTVPDAAHVFNPAFDVTPHDLITGWITEDGVFTQAQLAAWLA